MYETSVQALTPAGKEIESGVMKFKIEVKAGQKGRGQQEIISTTVAASSAVFGAAAGVAGGQGAVGRATGIRQGPPSIGGN